MAVIFDAQTTPTIAVAGGTSFSDTNLTIGASANALIVLISSAGDISTPTVTWNGVALTLLVQTVSTGVNGYAGIFGLTNPATGNQTLAGSWINSEDAFIAGVSFSGVDASSLAAAFPNTGSNTGTSTTAAVTTTSSVGDIVAAVQGVPFQSSTPPSPNNINIFNRVSAAGYGGSANRAAGAASVTLSATLFSSRAWAASGVDIGAAPSAAAQPRGPHVTKLPAWKFAPLLDQPYNQALYAVTVAALPFNPVEFAHSNILPDWQGAPPPPLNINLFTNPFPFNQTDWAKADTIPRAPFDLSVPLNPNLLNLFPFNQVDWSKPVTVPRAPWSVDQALNINLFTNPIPFLNLWGASDGWGFVNPLPPQPAYNAALYTVVVQAAPFNQSDWAIASRPRPPPPTFDALNINLFTNPYPVSNPTGSAAPWDIVGLVAPPQPYNAALYTIVVTTLPFNQTDWAIGVRQRPQPLPSDPLNLNLFTNPIPFNQVDWARPFPVPRAPWWPDAVFNNSLFPSTAVPAPFIPLDWSKPFALRGTPPLDPPLNINLFINPIPILNLAGSSRNIPGFAAPPQPYNINLYGIVVVTVLPFNQNYWPAVTRPAVVLPLPAPLNLNLFTNPIPFAQFDWSKPFPFPHPLPLPPLPMNLSLTAPIVVSTVLHARPFFVTMGLRPL